MAGLLKRLFKFGKKKDEEVETSSEVAAEEAAAAEVAAQQLAVEQELLRAEEAVAEAAEAERLAAEQERLAKEAADQKAAAIEAAEAEAVAEEARAREQMKREEAEQLAAEKAEQQRIAAEQAEQEKAEKQAAQDKAAQEQAAQEQAAREKAEREEAGRLAKEQAAAQKAQEDKDAAELAKAEAEAAQAQAQAEAQAQAQAQEKAEIEAAQAEEERIEAERIALEAQETERLRLEQEAVTQEPPAGDEDGVFGAPPETRQNETTETPEPLADTPEPAPTKKKWFARLKDGLSRSSNQLTTNITAVFTKKKLDEDTLQDLEDILIQADLGIETAMNVTDKLAKQRMGKDVTDEEVREFMAEEIEAVLEPVAAELELDLDHTPHVILVVGVNGSGKTTTIGKLSQKLYDAGFSTLLVAGDTFRAAAIEQLEIWGERTQSTVVSRPLGADSAGLAYDAYTLAKEEGRDVMLMDTAGRLQNKTELMDELEKIIRVLKKHDPEAPHTVLLTLDATTGQNALNQVEIFKNVSGVNGLVMTKLDGTARGGILVSISAKHKLPVYFLGVGESVDDLEPFEARDFARSIAGLS